MGIILSRTTNAKAVSTTLSDDFKAKVASDRATKAVAAQLAADKAAADPAMADAKTRLAWADYNDIAKDYPKEYQDAKTSISAADLAYNNGRYTSAKSLAEDASATLSDEFQSKVAADRKAAADKAAADKLAADQAVAEKAAADKAAAEQAAAEKAAQAQLAADKAAADPAMDDARNRMAWANDNGIKADYPEEYSDASSSMQAAEFTYSNGDYPLARPR
ncbi:MAG: hypothetical protein NT061_11930 [Spirochaetes bacterium]|nr:hypothetical protein [Spirochaetota bacterium]